ncbi:MAG: universal stress protein [Vulcanimicrobiaceae bacterium]
MNAHPDKAQGMRVVFFSDGSDDGFTAAKVLADLLDPRTIDCVAVVAVTWPQRHSPLWDKALELQFQVDDLHAAMAIAAAQCVAKLRDELARHANTVEEIITHGEPGEATLKVIRDVNADVAFLTVTSGPHRVRITQWVQEVTRRASCPVIVIHGMPAAATKTPTSL